MASLLLHLTSQKSVSFLQVNSNNLPINLSWPLSDDSARVRARGSRFLSFFLSFFFIVFYCPALKLERRPVFYLK